MEYWIVGYKPYFNVSLQITSGQTNIHFTLSLAEHKAHISPEKDACFQAFKYF